MIIVWSLAIYSCVVSTPMDGSYSKTCNWGGGTLHASKEHCETAAPKDGSDVFSDVADGRKVERHECREIRVY
jgi:hypothetical protein